MLPFKSIRIFKFENSHMNFSLNLTDFIKDPTETKKRRLLLRVLTVELNYEMRPPTSVTI